MKKSIKTILIIEDNKDILEAVRLLLEDAGYKINTIVKKEEIVRISKKPQPDIILLDMLLSGMDGRDIINRLKKQPETKHIPIILNSAHPNAKNIWKEVGADDFIGKPFDIEELKEVIRKNLPTESKK